MSNLPPPPPMPPPGPAPTSGSEFHCYRHPNREAGRRCTRCGRVACNECLVQASVGSQCVECLRAAQPAASERVRRWNASQPFVITKLLVAINVAVYVYMSVRDTSALSGTSTTSTAADLGLYRLAIDNGEWWRLITSGFIHFGLIHLGFNMFALWSLGQMLEPITSRVGFTLLYFSSLLAGSAGVLILDNDPTRITLTGGASGAVFGLFGAAAIALRQRGINPFQTSIGTVIILNLVLTFTIRGISIGGHVGGLVGGALAGAALFAPGAKHLPRWAVYGGPLAVGILSVVISFAVSAS